MATERNILITAPPGFSELSASLRVTANNDVLSFEFENDFTVEDIVVNVDDSLSYDVSLVFPSKLEFKLADTSSLYWFLNVPSNQGKNWYRLPAKSKIKVFVDSYSAARLLSLCVLGRGE